MSDDDAGSANSSPTKRIPKKKHYPFGTPSHKHHPYSSFAHLKVDNVNFAVDLATATNIEPEIVEEVVVKKKVSRKPPPKSVVSNGNEDPSQEIPDVEGSEPCTRIGCMQVVKAMQDIQYKNYVEQLEIEDESERLLEELHSMEVEVLAAENRLVKMNEIGNQLESQYHVLMMKVDKLEKKKETLNGDRSDTNNKVSSVCYHSCLSFLQFDILFYF